MMDYGEKEPKKKSLAVLIAGKIPPPGKKAGGRFSPPEESEGEEEEAGDEDLMGLESAMGDFLKAQKAGDVAGMASAFKEAAEICHSYEE